LCLAILKFRQKYHINLLSQVQTLVGLFSTSTECHILVQEWPDYYRKVVKEFQFLMHVFSIRDIENLTGIKAHTLRIWEQRYQLMRPTRKPGNHRIYNNDDLKYLLRISALYHRGHRISKIAQSSTEELSRLLLEAQATDDSYLVYINQLLDAAMDFDPLKFEKIIDASLEQYGFVRSIQYVLFPLLIKVGLLWLTDHAIPAQEHFASNIIMKKISVAIENLGTKQFDSRFHVVIFAPLNEFHELPILMMHYLLKERGIKSTYFGSNVSIESLQAYCSKHNVSHFYTHVITHLQKQEPEEFTAELSTMFPQQQIIISGPSTQSIKRHFANVHLIADELYMKSLIDYILNYAKLIRENY